MSDFYFRCPGFNGGFEYFDLYSVTSLFPEQLDASELRSDCKDIHGNNIYQGDKIKIKSCFNNDTFIVPVLFEDGAFYAEGSGLLSLVCAMNRPEIVGHIHEEKAK